MADNQFIATYGNTNQAQAAADDPYYQQWQYYQSTLDRGNVSGGVLDAPAGSLNETLPAADPETATVNPDGSVAPAGAQGEAADPASMLNPGLMADVTSGGAASATKKSLPPITWLALAVIAWWLWKKFA